MRVSLCLAAAAACAGPAHAVALVIVEKGVGLRPGAEPGPPPLVSVELIVDSRAGGWSGVVEQAAIRCREGGPTVRIPLTVPPGATHRQTVRLPVFSIRQEYRVRLLGAGDDGGRPLLAERTIVVSFPDALLDDPQRSLIAPAAYAALDEAYSLPTWPGEVRLTLFLACVLAAGAFAATLLIRRRGLRAIALTAALLVSCGAVVAGVLFYTPEELVVHWFDAPARTATTGPAAKLVAVMCRRSVVWEPRSDANLVPLYRDRVQAARDRMEMLVTGDSFAVRVPLPPDEVRIFR